MSRGGARIALRPDRCDRCGRCVPACPRRLVKVGAGYVFVDVSACDSCLKCAEACPRGAIVARDVRGEAPSARVSAAGEPKVVVGSRAEAKTLRQAAETAERDRQRAERHAAREVASEHRQAGVASRREESDAVAWTPVDALVVLGALALAFGVKEWVLASRPFEVMPPYGQVWARMAVLAAFYATLTAALALLARRHGSGFLRAFGLASVRHGLRDRAITAGLTLLLFLAVRVFSLAWGASAQALGWDPPATGTSGFDALFSSGGPVLLAGVVLVALVAPLVEELVFRGVVLTAAAERFGMWPGIVLAAAAFALSHLTAWVLVPTFVLGVALGWLAWARASLWAAVGLHVLYNATAVAALLAIGG